MRKIFSLTFGRIKMLPKVNKQSSSLPTFMSIVTAKEVTLYDDQNLVDILNDLKNLNVFFDRNYGFLVALGFTWSSD